VHARLRCASLLRHGGISAQGNVHVRQPDGLEINVHAVPCHARPIRDLEVGGSQPSDLHMHPPDVAFELDDLGWVVRLLSEAHAGGSPGATHAASVLASRSRQPLPSG
jgi:hypothetical protein